MKRSLGWVVGCAAACAAGACATAASPGASAAGAASSGAASPARDSRAASAVSAASGPAATALLAAASGGTAAGNARFVAVGNDKVGLHLEVENATPGRHGVFVSARSACGDAQVAAHYNPGRGAHHGAPKAAVRHSGDLGNLEVDASGKGTLDVVVADVSLASVQNGVVDRVLVVSRDADDLQTDPDGAQGPPALCGLILAPPVNR